MADTFDQSATHVAELWMTNEGARNDYWIEAAREEIDETMAWVDQFDGRISWSAQYAANRLGDRMRELVLDEAHDVLPDASILSDLMVRAISFTRWEDVARTFVDAYLDSLEPADRERYAVEPF